ncbi:hypothetical protein BU25DRAFT_457274 [Macroventuria anomochaeta]|uniref:Uncharacterized protein n=1 Tax=Macroventuria anomochaeta TaxID=301207 RepID=A0ACB6S735_9PLEO|nr:uncharacterized protein BU25DRAFT_457274 [Macroventuria anomochaeta]KAF2629019.1 hypothetical protein BU25DRAFT_457274 [Macroventuria anomochaeta]
MAYEKFVALLESTLRDNCLLFITEVNIKCSIALEMKRIYHSVLDVPGGDSAYRQHLKHLDKCLTNPTWRSEKFPDIQCCKGHVSEVMTLLNEFDRIVEERLVTEEHTPSQHRQVRDQMTTLLPEFERKLDLVEKRFPVGSKKRKDDNDDLAPQAFSKKSSKSTRTKKKPLFKKESTP